MSTPASPSTNELRKHVLNKFLKRTESKAEKLRAETREKVNQVDQTAGSLGQTAIHTYARADTRLQNVFNEKARRWMKKRYIALLVFLTLGFMTLMYYKRNTVLEYLRKILITKNVYLDPEAQQHVDDFTKEWAGGNQTFKEQVEEAVQNRDPLALLKIVNQARRNTDVPIETFAQTAASDVQRLLPTWKRTIFGIATGVTTGLGGIFVGAKRKWRDFVHPLRAEGIEEIGESGSHPRRIVRVRRQQVQEELNRRHNEHGRHLGTRMMSNQYSSAGIAGRRNVHNTAGTSR